MKKGQKLWTREELILTINLYCKLPFGKLHKGNPKIIELSKLLNRSPSSIALKLVNFASLDPSLKARGIKGASNASNLDKQIWHEFYHNWNILPYESEKLLAMFTNKTIEELNDIEIDELPKEGKTREAIVKVRVNQSFFRRSVMAAYNSMCCITGIKNPEFLIAGHIRPWGIDESNRLNPSNGLLINALHDKAFETGLITITPEYKVLISSHLKENSNPTLDSFFLKYENKEIILPSKFLPDREFLRYHNLERFKP